jgi:hypothetical protein
MGDVGVVQEEMQVQSKLEFDSHSAPSEGLTKRLSLFTLFLRFLVYLQGELCCDVRTRRR